MSCADCGCDLAVGAVFCPRCGQRVIAEPVGYAAMAFVSERERRVEQNVQALGIAWCFFGAYRILAVSAVMHAAWAFGWMGHTFWPAIGFSTVFFSALSVLAGVGLLTRRPWARKLAVVLGVLSLVKVPVGTGLGIYTLWVLGGRQGKEEWRRVEVG